MNWLFGDSKSAEKTIDAVINTGDKLVFTEEERADFNAETRKWYLEYLKATQPAALARRLIALVVVGVWAVLIISALIAKSFGGVAMANFTLSLLKEIVLEPFNIILGFYFLNQIIRDFKK